MKYFLMALVTLATLFFSVQHFVDNTKEKLVTVDHFAVYMRTGDYLSFNGEAVTFESQSPKYFSYGDLKADNFAGGFVKSINASSSTVFMTEGEADIDIQSKQPFRLDFKPGFNTIATFVFGDFMLFVVIAGVSCFFIHIITALGFNS